MYIICASFGSFFNIRLELILKYICKEIEHVCRIYYERKRTILSLSTYGKAILFMMYISENNTLKLRLCDGAAVHIRDESII